MKKTLAILFATVMALSLVACGGSGANSSATTSAASTATETASESKPAENTASEAPAANVDTVKIGVMLPFSGTSAATGELQMTGIQMYTDRVNENGGIQSLGGAQIELIKADTTGSPEVGATEMERLIAENPDMAAIIGPYQSGVGAAVVPIAEKYGMPFAIVNCTTDSVLGDPNTKYSFRANMCNWHMAVKFIDLFECMNAKAPDSVRKIAVVYESSDWGAGVYGNIEKYVVPGANVEIVLAESFDTGMSDFSAIINKLKNSDADVVIPLMYLSDAILWTTQMKEYDCKVPMVHEGGGFTVADYAPSAYDGLIGIGPWIADIVNSRSDEAKQIASEYEASTGAEMTEYEANGFLGMGTLVAAIEKAGSIDHDAIAEAYLELDLSPDDDPLLFMSYEGVKFGTLIDSIYNQNVEAEACAMQWRDGGWKYVSCSPDDPDFIWPLEQ